MLELFQYGFIIRGFEAGIIIAAIAPLIGIFLVLRRYSLIADTLAHVSLAGLAIGFVTKLNPLLTAILASVISSVFIEKIRLSKRIYGESALAIFLSGSLSLAIILISLGRGLGVNLLNYLFGSLVTVRESDVLVIVGLGALVLLTIWAFYKELVFVSFDEEAARVSGIPTGRINFLFITLAALTIAISIPIVGVLLISALIVIPPIASLQLKRSFEQTILWSEVISIFSMITGIITSFYLNISTGGTVVLISILVLITITLTRRVM